MPTAQDDDDEKGKEAVWLDDVLFANSGTATSTCTDALGHNCSLSHRQQ
jgi:hypothetical protein